MGGRELVPNSLLPLLSEKLSDSDLHTDISRGPGASPATLLTKGKAAKTGSRRDVPHRGEWKGEVRGAKVA